MVYCINLYSVRNEQLLVAAEDAARSKRVQHSALVAFAEGL